MSGACLLRATALGVALVLASTGCGTPPVFSTQDRRQNQLTGRIEGTVVVTGRARGNAVLFLFEANRPPPPQGTGRPVAFTLVPRDALFGTVESDSGDGGPFVAPFAFSLVPPGQYLIRGFIDRDACAAPQPGCRLPDFIPWYGVTSEPNAGDVGGAAVDAATLLPRLLTVPEDGAALTRVQVSFSEAATLPADRPSFRVTSGDGVVGPEGAVLELVPEPFEAGVIHQGRPAFLVRYVDADANGVPDDADGDGEPDLWPRVFVRKLADSESLLTEENDLDGDGVLDERGVEYVRADGSTDGFPDRVLLAATLEAPGITPSLQPAPAPSLRVNVRRAAFDVSNPSAPGRIAAAPPGRYALILVQFTGQTWRVPNELHPALAPALGLPKLESQAFFLRVP